MEIQESKVFQSSATKAFQIKKVLFCSKMRYNKITSEITWMEGTSGQHFINFRAQSHVRGNPVGQRQERNPRVAR